MVPQETRVTNKRTINILKKILSTVTSRCSL
jgi:hypothetical protein